VGEEAFLGPLSSGADLFDDIGRVGKLSGFGLISPFKIEAFTAEHTEIAEIK
jgi:hypothetical protein